MNAKLTVEPRKVRQSFMDFDIALDLDHLDADIAILGLPYGDPYNMDEVTNDQTNAPTAIRRASRRVSDRLERWDFDLGGPLLAHKPIRVVDCGDVPGNKDDLGQHYRHAELAVRKILQAGAMPISTGSMRNPVFAKVTRAPFDVLPKCRISRKYSRLACALRAARVARNTKRQWTMARI
jgi:arginase family enzyme